MTVEYDGTIPRRNLWVWLLFRMERGEDGTATLTTRWLVAQLTRRSLTVRLRVRQ